MIPTSYFGVFSYVISIVLYLGGAALTLSCFYADIYVVSAPPSCPVEHHYRAMHRPGCALSTPFTFTRPTEHTQLSKEEVELIYMVTRNI